MTVSNTADQTQTTISSPPSTVFNLKSFLDTVASTPAHEPNITKQDNVRFLLWLENTPLLFEIPDSESLHETTSFTVYSIGVETTESDITDLVWGHLSNCLVIIDPDQIHSEAQASAGILVNAYTAAEEANTAISNAYSKTESIEKDSENTDFHISIEELATHIDSAEDAVDRCQETLSQFESDLTNKDIKESKYNSTAITIISNCENTIQTITEVQDTLPSITPDTQTQAFDSIRSYLDVIHTYIHQILERIDNLYTAATDTSILTQFD